MGHTSIDFVEHLTGKKLQKENGIVLIFVFLVTFNALLKLFFFPG